MPGAISQLNPSLPVSTRRPIEERHSFMKHTALLLTLLTSLPLGACSVAPLDTAGPSDEQTSSTSSPLLWYVANPAPTVIDFDLDPAQAAIADGTVVDSTYTSLGVTLTCVVCASGHAYSRLPGRTGNGVSVFQSPYVPVYDSRYGAVRADFNTARSWVSIDVLAVLPPEYVGTPVATPWFEAYDATGALVVPTVYYPAYGTPGFGQWQTLRIDDPKGSIKYVRFSSQHFNSSASVYGQFDNLSFNTDPYYVNLTPIKKQIVQLPPGRPLTLAP
jgi:hypothetical protein